MSDKPSSGRVRLYDDDLPMPQSTGRVGRPTTDLSKIERRFCDLWMTHYDESQISRTAMQAGYGPPSRAYLTGRRLLRDARCRQYIAVVESDRMRRMRFDGDAFLSQEYQLATAQVTFQRVAIPPCRYCWGTNFEYQRTHAEFQEAFEAWCRLPDRRRRNQKSTAEIGGSPILIYDDADKKIPFDQRGGDGYDSASPPNPACPNCRGRGNEDPEHGSLPYVSFKPTDLWSADERALFAGIKQGTRGPEILVRNQDAARTRLMGMLGKFLELRAAGQVQSPSLGFGIGIAGGVADLLTDDPSGLSDAQLDALLLSYNVPLSTESDGPSREGEDRRAGSGKGPPPGRIA